MYKVTHGYFPVQASFNTNTKKNKQHALNLGPSLKDTIHFQGCSEESMHVAAESGSFENFSRLVSQANVSINWQDNRGNTALLKAVHDPAKVRLLLEKGADPTIANHFGNTPLMKAAQVGNLTSTRLLIEALKAKNSDFTKVINKEYNTALHLAASRGHAEIVEYLVKQGFSPALLNLDKESPLTIAKDNGHSEVVAKLKALALSHPLKEVDQPVHRLFSEVCLTHENQLTTAPTHQIPSIVPQSIVLEAIAPVSSPEPELSPYQTLLNSFMQGGSLFQEDPTIVRQILKDSDLFEEFTSRLTDDMAGSADTKAEMEQGLCHQYFMSSGALQQFWHKVIQTVTERLPQELAQDYPETQKMLSIVIPEQIQPNSKPKKFGFNNVAGMEKLKEYLRKHVIDPLQGVEDDEFDIPKPNGILFFGPSRTGKTHIARALADELNMNFISVSGADIFSSYQGQSITNTKALFERARTLAKEKPVVLFFDEINQIVPNRRNVLTNNADMPRIVDQFLLELDEAGKDGIFTIGTSNLPTAIDNGIMQPGRLDRTIPIGLPDQKARAQLFQFCLEANAKKNLGFTPSVYEDLANQTAGFSAGDIKQVVSEGIQAYRYHKKEKPLIDYLIQAAKSVQPANSEKEIQAFKQYVQEKRLTDAVEL